MRLVTTQLKQKKYEPIRFLWRYACFPVSIHNVEEERVCRSFLKIELVPY